MGRGLYHQFEGWENRSSQACFEERLADNEVCEGKEVQRLHELISDQDWISFNVYVADLLDSGWSQARVDSMITRAKAKVRF